MPTPEIHRAMQQAVGMHQAGRLAEAEPIYRRVLEKEPRNPDALQLLGLLAHQTNRNELAVELISKAVTIKPRAEFVVNLSQALRALGRLQESLEACQRGVQLGPTIPEAWNNLGLVLKDLNRPAEAVEAIRRAIQLRAGYAIAHNNLGNALAQLGKAEEAEAALRQAIAVDPGYADAYSNLGHFVGRLGRLDEAVALINQAIAIRPMFAAYINLGTALHLQGHFDQGQAAYQRGLALAPDHVRLHENILGGHSYTTRLTPRESLDAHVAWAKRFAEPATPIAPAVKNRKTDRRLRIGYVSPDFRRHSVAYFLEPIIEQHDRAGFEITGYSNTELTDEVTDRLRSKCDRWRETLSLSDEQMASMIRRDEIDILIDLAGHTTGNRLQVFGMKPAPVQMTYLGYPNTTGLSAMDYRITDELADPVGMTDSHYTEKLLRVPAPFLCYRPPEGSPDVVNPPVVASGRMTFGSFNKAAKIGPETFALWSKVLNAVEGSTLLLKSRGLGDRGSRQRILAGFAAHGITGDRLTLIEGNQSLHDHLASYGLIDISLDTFPYHGTTTTCEALWMGVPVVSRIGQTHVSRVGLSLLTTVGLSHLATELDETYVHAVKELAANPVRLNEERRRLRQTLAISKLCDAGRLAKLLEASFRQVFAE